MLNEFWNKFKSFINAEKTTLYVKHPRSYYLAHIAFLKDIVTIINEGELVEERYNQYDIVTYRTIVLSKM